MLFTITVWDPGIGVKVFVEHLGDLRTNPFEEGEFNESGIPPRCPKINKVQGVKNKGFYKSKEAKCFCLNSQILSVLRIQLKDDPEVITGRILPCWNP